MTDDWDALLAQLSPEVVALVTAADELVRRTDPAAVRVEWPHQKTVGYGVGPKKMSEHYAYLAVHPRHVNLGCNYGARLDDGGLLEGTGRNMRKLTVPQRQAKIDAQMSERKALNDKLSALVEKRDAFVAEKRKAVPKPASSFDAAVEATLKAQIKR